MDIPEATLVRLREALPYMSEGEIEEALLLLGDEFSVLPEQRPPTPAEFREALSIEANGEIRTFAAVEQPWQAADFKVMDEAWMGAVGLRPPPAIRRAWWERPKAHSKTSDVASYLVWALTYAVRPVQIVCGAEDLDQAALMRNAVQVLVDLNRLPLEVKRKEIVNHRTRSEVKILTSDAPSTHGISPDAVIADEVCHWRSDAMWNTLMASHDKRSWSLFQALTNAGWTSSWAWQSREKVRQDPAWHFSRLENPVAAWVTPEMLANERNHLTNPLEYQRLWLNVWVSGTAEGIPDYLITAAVDHNLRSLPAPEPAMVCAAGLDLGVKRHRSALYVVGLYPYSGPVVAQERDRSVAGAEEVVLPAGRLRLLYGRNWKPTPGKQVKLDAEVEPEVERVAKAYRCPIVFDPYEMSQMAERLTRRGVRMVPWPQTPSNKQKMATAILEAFNDQRFSMFHDGELEQDLREASIVESTTGYCLVSPDNERGHGDSLTATSLAMMGLKAGPMVGGRARLAALLGIPDDIANTDLAAVERAPAR